MEKAFLYVANGFKILHFFYLNQLGVRMLIIDVLV